MLQELETLAERINQNPSVIEGWWAVYQFDVSGEQGGTYQVQFNNNHVQVTEGKPNQSQCTLQLSDSNFKKLLQKQLNPTTALMLGKIKIKGDIALALRLQSLFA
ncbi:sterol carrier protein [Brevibacillus laterosporus]|uniref:Sterol carrier protein n=1 Tax=Brevibacillus laterosporus TaxID=1465 RepID=A0A502IAJ0_BRELA|nr:SCP2 sterol-binding domain-containing protein [Brevibacillus laterosporus]QDX94517.1 sterol carrier protein [Brevibacillus laterosporus]TPG83083.1 sterol carrier protein [Brevibacillus laterosporus]